MYTAAANAATVETVGNVEMPRISESIVSVSFV